MLRQGPYLKEQLNFPADIDKMSDQINQAYIDIAQKVNSRTIGIFADKFSVVTGEQWYLSGQSDKQQTLRQLFPFTTSAPITHGINWSSLSLISPHSYGTYTDDTNWYGVIYANNQPIANQVSFYVTPTQIIITVNGTAPAITSGVILLEWLSKK